MSDTNEGSGGGYLSGTTSMFGHLAGDVRDRLIAVLANPSQETWEDAYTLIVNGDRFLTLWQAVLVADPSFPRSKGVGREWDRVPDYDTIAMAIRYAVTGAC